MKRLPHSSPHLKTGTQLGFGTFRSLSLSPAQLLEAAGVFRRRNPRPMPSWLTGTQKGKADDATEQLRLSSDHTQAISYRKHTSKQSAFQF